ncbi:MAG: hypothetical protein AAF316_00110 [Cyanobacteria bacterium P01_A01_bin.80]
MVYSNWDYSKRRFDPLPAGFIAETEHHQISSGVLSVADGVYVSTGLGVILDSLGDGKIRNYRLPSDAGDATDFGGVLLFDQTNYRNPAQPIRTHSNMDMINVIRAGKVRVHVATTATLTDINAPVYLIHTAATDEKVGEFKTTAGANSFLLKNAKWGTLLEPTAGENVATLELLGNSNPA